MSVEHLAEIASKLRDTADDDRPDHAGPARQEFIQDQGWSDHRHSKPGTNVIAGIPERGCSVGERSRVRSKSRPAATGRIGSD